MKSLFRRYWNTFRDKILFFRISAPNINLSKSMQYILDELAGFQDTPLPGYSFKSELERMKGCFNRGSLQILAAKRFFAGRNCQTPPRRR